MKDILSRKEKARLGKEGVALVKPETVLPLDPEVAEKYRHLTSVLRNENREDGSERFILVAIGRPKFKKHSATIMLAKTMIPDGEWQTLAYDVIRDVTKPAIGIP